MKKIYERPSIRQLNVGYLNKFGTKTELTPIDNIDNVPVKRLLQEYGSPLFVISEKTMRNTYRKASRAFKTRYPKIQFAWSYKTNYLNAVCNVFHQEGSWAEVVSIFEYKKAIGNGVPGDKIIFNGPGKSKEDLKLAVANNSLIHIDHFDELYTLTELLKDGSKKARVAIRINMDTGVYPMWDRFGFNYENGQAWNAINKIMSQNEMILEGLHCHIGTYMLSTTAYSIAAQKLCDLMNRTKNKWNHTLSYLDFGGGFASANTLKGSYLQAIDVMPSFDDYAEVITSTVLNFGFTKEELPLIILETGRAMIDDAGTLLGTVIANKILSDGRKATIFNFGINILFTAFWYNHKISPAQQFSSHTEETVCYGPLCMNIDIVNENISLPLLNEGDNVVVHRVGAYNMTQWMQFIDMRPKVVLIDMNGEVHIIRENETIDTIEQLERKPKHLTEIAL